MSKSTSDGAGSKDVLRALARALAPHLRHILKLNAADASGEYYDQKTSPLGRRKHLELVRRGVLPGFKQGKSVFARREDVRELIQNHAVAVTESVEDDGTSYLDDWGLTPRRQR